MLILMSNYINNYLKKKKNTWVVPRMIKSGHGYVIFLINSTFCSTTVIVSLLHIFASTLSILIQKYYLYN